MHRLPVLLGMLFLAVPTWAQEADDQEPDPNDSRSTEAADPAADAPDDADDSLDDIDDADVLYDEEDDDAFIPSENVKYGQSIPFPTDI